MATSGLYTYMDNRNQLIKDAFSKAGIIDDEETLTAAMVAKGNRILNRMIKSWFNIGYNVWAFEDVIVFPVYRQNIYTLGSSARACYLSDFAQTTLAAAALTAATSITLTDATDFAISDNIAIANGTVMIWRTVSNKVGNVITLNTALGADIDEGATIFGYTSNIPKPLSIQTLRIQTGIEPNTAQMNTNEIGMNEYNNLASKLSEGTPNQWCYLPKIDNGTLYVYPTSSDERQYYALSIQRPIQDFTNAGDNPDFPIEWHNALVYNLAKALGTDYSIESELFARISQGADEAFIEATSHDNHQASTSFLPNMSCNGWGYYG